MEIKDRHYIKHLKEIREAYQESKDWGDVYSTSVYSDVYEAQEAFIDYVEEIYQTKVKDGKHLQKLTGITHLDSWDSSLVNTLLQIQRRRLKRTLLESWRRR